VNSSEFPDFIKKLPRANITVNGLNGWLLQSNDGQMLFNESEVETIVPEHSHGDQWGIVIDGIIELTVNGKTNKYSRGDSYFIAGGTVHSARIYPGFRAIDYFKDKDRYKTL
jgi:quercetin dioxygenase-like cupin family protein